MKRQWPAALLAVAACVGWTGPFWACPATADTPPAANSSPPSAAPRPAKPQRHSAADGDLAAAHAAEAHGDVAGAITALQHGLAAATDDPRPVLELAGVYLSQCRFADADTLLLGHRAQLTPADQPSIDQARAFNLLQWAKSLETSAPVESAEHYAAARSLVPQIPSLAMKYRILLQCADASQRTGDNRTALATYDEARAIAHDNHDSRREGGILLDMATVYGRLGEMDKQAEATKQGLALVSGVDAPAGPSVTEPQGSAANAQLVVQTAVPAPGLCAQFSPDGGLLAVGSGSPSGGDAVTIWDMRTQMAIKTLTGFGQPVEQVAFVRGGNWLVARSGGNVSVWDLHTFRPLYQLATGVRSIAVNRGSQVATLGTDLRIWSVSDGKLLDTVANSENLACCKFDVDGDKLAVGGVDGSLRIFSLPSASTTSGVGHVADPIDDIQFLYDGRIGVISGANPPNGPSKLSIFKGWNDQHPAIIDLGGIAVGQLNLGGTNPSFARLIVKSAGGIPSLQVIDLLSATIVKRLPIAAGTMAVCLSPDGRYAATTGSVGNSGQTTLIDLSTGAVVSSLTAHSAQPTTIAVSRDGSIFACADQLGNVRLWNLDTGRATTLSVKYRPSPVMAMSPSGDRLYVAKPSGLAIDVWSSATGRLVATLLSPAIDATSGATRAAGIVTEIAASPDGKLLAILRKRDGAVELVVWTLATNRQVTVPVGAYSCRSLTFDPSSARVALLATSSDDARQSIAVWTTSGAKISACNVTLPFERIVCEGGSNNLIAVCRGDKTIDELDPASGAKLRTIVTAESVVNDVDVAGDKLVVALESGAVVTYDLTSGSVLNVMRRSGDAITAARVTSGGARIVSAGADGIVRIWRANDGHEMARLVGVGTDDYLAATPDNYFMGSRAAFSSVGFRIGTDVYPFEQFDLQRDCPDIVLESLGSGNHDLVASYRAARQRRLALMGLPAEPNDTTFDAPTCVVDYSRLAIATSARSLSLPFTAQSKSSKLARVVVYVNDVPVTFRLTDHADEAARSRVASGSSGVELAAGDKSLSGIVSLDLCAGANKIEVVAVDDHGVESYRRPIRVTFDAKPHRRLFVLAVGISHYDGVHDLDSAYKDAASIASTLAGLAKKRDVPQVVVVVPQKLATREAILAAKATLMKSGVDDEVVVFIAGHGLLDSNMNYYFATRDVDFAHPEKRGMSYDQIEGLLDGIPARRKLLLMDTCHAGEVDKSASHVTKLAPGTSGVRATDSVDVDEAADHAFELQEQLFADLRRGCGATVIAASRGSETAGENNHHGYFTQAILDTLAAHPTAKVSELRDQVAAAIDAATHGAQRPIARRENLDNDFAVIP